MPWHKVSKLKFEAHMNKKSTENNLINKKALHHFNDVGLFDG